MSLDGRAGREIEPSESAWLRRPRGDEGDAPSHRPAERVPSLVFENNAVYAYALDDLFIMVWRGVVSDESLAVMHKAMERAARSHRDGIAIMSVIERGATPPSPSQRATVREFQASMGKRFRCLALVIDGMGFWASMALAVATSILSARRKTFPQSVCRTVEEGVEFIVRKSPGMPSADPAALLGAIAFSRADASTRALRVEYPAAAGASK